MADDDIISGGLDIVTDKTKNKPKAEQETAQPTAARFKKNKPTAEHETAQPTAARFKKPKADLEPRPPTAARLITFSFPFLFQGLV